MSSLPPTRSSRCDWCPYAAVGTGLLLRQTDEQSRECVYERKSHSCKNGGIKCYRDLKNQSCV